MMATVITDPTAFARAGPRGRAVLDYIRENLAKAPGSSVALLQSPGQWTEPGQRLSHYEYALVIRGILHVRTKHGLRRLRTGEALLAEPGEWIQLHAPHPGRVEYILASIESPADDLFDKIC